MYNFHYYAPTNVVFGKDAESKVGELVKQQGSKKVLIHYGGTSAIKSGLLERVENSLKESNIEYVLLGGVVPNPRLSLVYEGIDLCKEEEVDFILAVGGGSVIDSAKAIAWGVPFEGDVWELYEKKKETDKALPLGCILTIAAAGSEMSSGSVITKDEGGLKRDYGNDNIRPKFSIMNPELTMTLPAYQTAAGCSDILIHTLERYFVEGDKMATTTGLAESLMRTIIHYAKVLHQDPNNYDARAEIMWCSSLSHNGLTECGNKRNDFASHMIEHELSGMFDVTHGAGLAVVWPSWARYVYKDCLDKFACFAVEVMGLEDKEDKDVLANEGIDALEAFFQSIDMPVRISDMGIDVTEEQLRHMAASCSQAAGGGSIGSAKALFEEDMYQILKNAK